MPPLRPPRLRAQLPRSLSSRPLPLQGPRGCHDQSDGPDASPGEGPAGAYRGSHVSVLPATTPQLMPRRPLHRGSGLLGVSHSWVRPGRGLFSAPSPCAPVPAPAGGLAVPLLSAPGTWGRPWAAQLQGPLCPSLTSSFSPPFAPLLTQSSDSSTCSPSPPPAASSQPCVYSLPEPETLC